MKQPVKGWVWIVTATLAFGVGYTGTVRAKSRDSALASLLLSEFLLALEDTGKLDTGKLKYDIKDTRDPLNKNNNPYYLSNAGAVQTAVVFDPTTRKYIITEKIGGVPIKAPLYMTFDEYMKWEAERGKSNYWKEKTNSSSVSSLDREGGRIVPKLYIGNKLFDRIFGGNNIDIRPQGNAELRFAYNRIRNDNPGLTQQQRTISNFDFQQNIQLNVTGSIGEKLKFSANQNTQALFNFENQMKLGYTGYEDEIIKKIEAGNVSLPLRSALITGSQSLFGLKTELQFGKLRVTTILSQQQGRSQSIQVQGGTQRTRFDIPIDQYDMNRHYFLAEYFYQNFNRAMSSLPVLRSNVVITRVEVWVTNRNMINPDVRDILAFQDLGEPAPWDRTGTIVRNPTVNLPANEANNLMGLLTDPANVAVRESNRTMDELYTSPTFNKLSNTLDYEKTFARKLTPSDFTFHPQLGYISLNQALNNDEVLGVAFEYTYNGVTYRVGEFSNEVPIPNQDNPTVLFLKMLKGTTIRPSLPIWRLMMKNIYSLNAFQISRQDFQMNIVYTDMITGNKNFIPEGGLAGKQLIQVLGLDNLNVNLEPTPDGIFDFIEGVTINSQMGRIILPRTEPFGSDLIQAFQQNGTTNTDLIRKYVFTELYDSTRAWAVQFPQYNRFRLQGQYQSASGSEISLNAINLPPNSVQVTAGGQRLNEGSDYQVDYMSGKVRILNQGILASGQPINISFENNPLFNMQQRTMTATRLDYRVNKDFTLGSTILNLRERPIAQKVNLGDEPVNNTLAGIDGAFNTESRFLTKLVDAIPFINTKEVSTLNFSGEYARLFPSNSKQIQGMSYIDDFEGSRNALDIRLPGAWSIAPTPMRFPESALFDSLPFRYNAAKVAWYNIDPLFFRSGGITPEHIRNDNVMKSNHYMREVLEQEVFPNRQYANNQPTNIATFDVMYIPNERGQYNYESVPSSFSAGIDQNGKLNNPRSRWGGIMRKVETNDWEAANIEFIEFWLMDPFYYKPNHTGGDLYINIGNINEDVLRDGRRTFENGMPRVGSEVKLDTTAWGRVPRLQPLVNAFDNDPASRTLQDIGLDGWNDDQERAFFDTAFLNPIANAFGTNSVAYQRALEDPSSDNYHHYRGTDYDNEKLNVIQRYGKFNGFQGNSPTDQNNPEPYPTSQTNLPNTEDLNLDNTLTQTEDYWEYKVSLKPSDLVQVGQNNIVSIQPATVQLKDGSSQTINWYQIRIPVNKPDRRVGNIADWKSIRFIRLYYTGFDDTVITRFATFQLVRTDWRRYNQSMRAPGEYIPNDDGDNTFFFVSTVSYEENSTKSPVPYNIPPGIQRVQNVFTTNFQQLNEQALQLRFCNLQDGDTRAAFKNTTFDIRSYKRIKMFMHCEAPANNQSAVKDGDLRGVIRFANDFEQNFYEYEVPLKVSQPNNRDPLNVWPEQNNMSVAFTDLQGAKLQRDKEGWPLTVPYEVTTKEGNTIRILGNPNLSNIQILMLMVRNPKKIGLNSADDGLSKCGEVWFNELRLTDLDERSGWAATSTMQIKLADFAQVNVTGLRKTIGFGGVDTKPVNRNRDDITQFNLTSSFELGKFFPQKFGIRIPMFLNYGMLQSRPEFNPINRDIPMVDLLKLIDDPRQRDSIIRSTETFNQQRGINFTNVQKQRSAQKKKIYPWDISNFSFSFAYNEIYMRDPFTNFNTTRQYTGGFNYTYTPKVPVIEPFKKLVKAKYLKFIKDINFQPYPSSITFRTDFNRLFQEMQLRNNADGGLPIPATFNKNFMWNRVHGVRWDLTKSLRAEINATTNARIDEPVGKIDTREKKDSILSNIRNLGRPMNYNQTSSLNYTLPFSKIPILDWVNANATYSANYTFIHAPLAADSLGNTISNGQNAQLSGQMNLTGLYNKVKFLKKINENKPFESKKKKDDKNKKDPKNKDKTPGKEKNQFGEEVDKITTDKSQEIPQGEKILRNFAKMIMAIKNVGGSYNITRGTTIPGFLPTPNAIGNDWNLQAPGLPFVFGDQRDLKPTIVTQQWLTKDTNLNAFYLNTRSENLQGRMTVEPFKDFRIELNAAKTRNYRLQDNFRANAEGLINSINQVESGDYSITTITWRTAFERLEKKSDQPNYLQSDNFKQFENNRFLIANRLAALNPNSSGTGSIDTVYPDGYSRKSTDVLIPAFYSAYTGQNAGKANLSPFPTIPLPNWRITYSGLTQIGPLGKWFQNITLSHGYTSRYSVNNFISNMLFRPDAANHPTLRDTVRTGDFYPKYQIAQITITENFQPLIGIDATMQNNITFRVEYRKMRTMSLSLLNNRLSQMNSTEFTIGVGWRITKPIIPIVTKGNKQLNNDLNIRFDFNIRDNFTILYDLDGQDPQPSVGMTNISIKPNIDYQLNDKVNLRLFFDRMVNRPYISNTFPNANSNGGISIRFTLAQ